MAAFTGLRTRGSRKMWMNQWEDLWNMFGIYDLTKLRGSSWNIYIWLLLWNIYGIIYGRSKFQWYFLTVIMTGIGESSCATHGTLDKMDNMTEIYDWNI